VTLSKRTFENDSIFVTRCGMTTGDGDLILETHWRLDLETQIFLVVNFDSKETQ